MNTPQLPPAAPQSRPWLWALLGLVLLGVVSLGTGLETAGFFGYLLAAVLGALWAVLLNQRERLALLEARLLAAEHALRFAAASPAKAEQPPAPPSEALPVPEAQGWGPPPTVVPEPAAVFAPEPLPAAISPPAARPAAPPEPTPLDKAWSSAWGWLRGGNPLAKVGVVILFFGAVFLIKYAADQQLFPMELRFAALGAGATTLLVLGWRWRLAKPGYAQVLQGGGIAGLYLVSFAAAKLYQLLPLPVALAVMVAVAVLAAVLAVAQESLAMAVIGTAGGFLAPLLVSTGSGNHIALFTYYAILNLGVFTVAWFRAWRVLNLLGLFFTFGIVGAFRGLSYDEAQRLSTDAFLLLFFLMYVAVSVLFALRQKPDLKGTVSASLVFGLPVAAFGIHASLWRGVEFALAWSALGFGVFYLALARLLWNRHRDTLRLLCEAFAALGVIFASLAIPLAFDEQATSVMWAVEGAGLVWLGVRQERRLARAFGLLLQAGSSAALLLHGGVGPEALPLANGQFIGFVVLGVTALATGTWLRQLPSEGASRDRALAPVAVVIGTLWIAAAGIGEASRTVPDILVAAVLVWLSVLAMGWQSLGQRLAWPLWDALAVALMTLGALLALGCTAAPVHGVSPHPAALGGWLGWPVWLAAQTRQLWRREGRSSSLVTQHMLSALLLALLLAWELGWQVQRLQPEGFWQWLPSAAVLVAALLLLTRVPLVPAWPLARHEQAYRGGVGSVLALFAALWLLAANLGSAGAATPLPTWPVFNPLDLASLGLLLALARYGRGSALRVSFGLAPQASWALAAGLVFVWLNSALVRGLHYGLGTPLFGQGALESTLLQAAFSVFWSLLAFAVMLFAARRGQRTVWLAGAALMAVVVAKLFVVDTANTGTLARIVAFFAVGAVLLVTGYLAPLPPTARPAEEPER